MPRTLNEERIPVRMPTAVYDRLVEAAQAVGDTQSVSRPGGPGTANAILEEERVIKLSAASSEALFAIMETPPEPNEYLKDAMRYRKATLCRK
jgi:uncharacterized protein (DUF1778 family)